VAAAGNPDLQLFRWPSMVANPQRAAAAGYRAMMQGRALVIPGLTNKLIVQLNRLTPRMLMRRIAGMLNYDQHAQES
jgi:short-subunit dehydrogenase